MGDNNPFKAGKIIGDFESLIFPDRQDKPDAVDENPVEQDAVAKSEFVDTDPRSKDLTKKPPQRVMKFFRS